MNCNDYEYAGFGIRLFQFVVDTVLWLSLVTPVYVLVYGDDFVSVYSEDETGVFLGMTDFWLSIIMPMVVVIGFWTWKSATPAKIFTKTKIVDQATGNKPSFTQFVIRYFGQLVSLIFLGLGYIWIAIDKRNQSWHDKMAGTVVIRRKPISQGAVSFEGIDRTVATSYENAS